MKDLRNPNFELLRRALRFLGRQGRAGRACARPCQRLRRPRHRAFGLQVHTPAISSSARAPCAHRKSEGLELEIVNWKLIIARRFFLKDWRASDLPCDSQQRVVY